jgi:alkanesulfonate monooxygenase SsuD/methylene tetrahydromethanopterin reductase-like flavin-dependent oxidoreductase (luciferase family)
VEVGVALPQMAPGYGPRTTVDWSRLADEGPFSSISAGERVTFSNPEMVASLAAAAAVTTRIRIFANLWVLPTHAAAMVAQQVTTLDQLSDGRLSIAVGVGAREDDYRALDVPWAGRHARLDADVAELRRLLDGAPPFEGSEPVGPGRTQASGPEILAGALGPRSMARAARWADGVSGFSLSGRSAEVAGTNQRATQAWAVAGRSAPRLVNGTFFVLGVADPLATLRAFTARYLGFTGAAFAEAAAAETTAATPDAVREVLDGAEAAGCDEFVLVPGSTDLRCLAAAAEVVSAWHDARR